MLDVRSFEKTIVQNFVNSHDRDSEMVICGNEIYAVIITTICGNGDSEMVKGTKKTKTLLFAVGNCEQT